MAPQAGPEFRSSSKFDWATSRTSITSISMLDESQESQGIASVATRNRLLSIGLALVSIDCDVSIHFRFERFFKSVGPFDDNGDVYIRIAEPKMNSCRLTC